MKERREGKERQRKSEGKERRKRETVPGGWTETGLSVCEHLVFLLLKQQ